MKRIANPARNIWRRMYPHPIPLATAPPNAPAPRSPSLELKNPIAAPIIIAIIRIVNHIIISNILILYFYLIT